jgi:hypothetical protein
VRQLILLFGGNTRSTSSSVHNINNNHHKDYHNCNKNSTLTQCKPFWKENNNQPQNFICKVSYLIQAFKKLIHCLHTNTETIKSRHDNNLKTTTKNITVPHDQVLKKTHFTQKQEHPLTHHTSYLKNHKITAIPSDQKHNLQQKNSNATPTHMKHFVGSHATYPDNNFPQK